MYMTECIQLNSLRCLYLVAEHLRNIKFVQFTGECLQRGECAASVAVWIRQRATIALFVSIYGVAQPSNLIEGYLELQVRHLVFIPLHRGVPLNLSYAE